VRLGFVGLGNLGGQLAGRLVHGGFQLTVHDRDRAAAEGLLAAGAGWADSPVAVARASESVVTCLPSPRAVAEVVCDPQDGLLAGLAPGATWIDTSTNDLHELRRIATLAQDAGIHCLEAPVTGGVHLAAAGRLTVLVGGERAIFESHRRVLEALGRRILYLGPLGSASVMKVITNMLALTHVVALGEALMLARRAGLDLATAFDAIRNSSGNSFVHETESQVILNGSYNIGFTLDLACKDLGFAHALGREHGVPLELTALAEQTFVRAREQYGGSAWSPMVVRLLEDALRTDLRAPGFPATIQAAGDGAVGCDA